MEIPYFPGCTLFEKAKELNKKAKDIASNFGYTLYEIPDWTCCGAVFPNSLQNIMKFSGPYRMLASAEKLSDKLLTLCSACYNVMKRSNNVIRENKDIKEKLGFFTGVEYKGGVEVMHYLEFLRDIITYEKLKEHIKIKKARKVSPYYGCLILRPYEELGLDDPENPKLISDIITAAGDEAIEFPAQNECCGAYLTVKGEKGDLETLKRVASDAKQFGAELLVTSCPLCHFNLTRAKVLTVTYFTEYLASSLGLG